MVNVDCSTSIVRAYYMLYNVYASVDYFVNVGLMFQNEPRYMDSKLYN